MELATSLQSQSFQNRVREVGIDPNHWYPVSWADRLKPGCVVPVTVWQQRVALFRGEDGGLGAIEDSCPHKGVAMHRGEIRGDRLLCAYHGWEFNKAGECVGIPYYPPSQKLPCARARSFPVREECGVIWLFPGDPALAERRSPPHAPEYDDPDWLPVPITGDFDAHFSIANENAMDVFHSFLHRDLQGWFDPVLLELQEENDSVFARYRVSYRNVLSQAIGLSEDGRQTKTRVVTVRYQYPHYHSTLEDVSSLYLMRLPVGPAKTRSFSLLFLKLPILGALPKKPRSLLAKTICNLVFMRFLRQDVVMMVDEQQAFEENPQRRYVEINPAIIALQRVIVRQYEQFMQQSSQATLANSHGKSQESVPA